MGIPLTTVLWTNNVSGGARYAAQRGGGPWRVTADPTSDNHSRHPQGTLFERAPFAPTGGRPPMPEVARMRS